jgi:hypothetical protein
MQDGASTRPPARLFRHDFSFCRLDVRCHIFDLSTLPERARVSTRFDLVLARVSDDPAAVARFLKTLGFRAENGASSVVLHGRSGKVAFYRRSASAAHPPATRD